MNQQDFIAICIIALLFFLLLVFCFARFIIWLTRKPKLIIEEPPMMSQTISYGGSSSSSSERNEYNYYTDSHDQAAYYYPAQSVYPQYAGQAPANYSEPVASGEGDSRSQRPDYSTPVYQPSPQQPQTPIYQPPVTPSPDSEQEPTRPDMPDIPQQPGPVYYQPTYNTPQQTVYYQPGPSVDFYDNTPASQPAQSDNWPFPQYEPPAITPIAPPMPYEDDGYQAPDFSAIPPYPLEPAQPGYHWGVPETPLTYDEQLLQGYTGPVLMSDEPLYIPDVDDVPVASYPEPAPMIVDADPTKE
jgi:hypothetical protein